jgi:phosphatidyl-N-methylethanolamine N-methyltransferase
VNAWLFACAAVLLSVERLCYLWIWRAPGSFRSVCASLGVASPADPVDVLRSLFYAFKALQAGVFVAWCYVYGNGSIWPPDGAPGAVWLGGAMILAGQVLNAGVFYRLGELGVFYGNRLGYDVPWSQQFPFSLLDHPQYVGALLSIWGFFLVMRFPHDDWYLLPALETLYYALGAKLER